MLKELLIATNNPGKQVELEYLLKNLSVRLLYPSDLGINIDVEETGETYYENALLKARSFFLSFRIPTLADDSGLEVDPLNGKPGINSHRFSSKPNASDRDRRHFLLEQLAFCPRPWRAKFCCVIVIIDEEGIPHQFGGFCHGEIIPEERGNNGFGYDPIFFIPELNSTMAELPDYQKNSISHRANAIKSALHYLQSQVK